jgi:hypothetical protein
MGLEQRLLQGKQQWQPLEQLELGCHVSRCVAAGLAAGDALQVLIIKDFLIETAAT